MRFLSGAVRGAGVALIVMGLGLAAMPKANADPPPIVACPDPLACGIVGGGCNLGLNCSANPLIACTCSSVNEWPIYGCLCILRGGGGGN